MESQPIQVLRWADISMGQKASLRVHFTPEVVEAFAKLTGDINPLHMSAEFAKGKGFDDRLAHGLLVASFFSAIAGTMLPGRDCIIHYARFDYKKPVYVGAKLDLEAEVVQKVEAFKVLMLQVTATDETGNVVLGGRIQTGVLE